MKQVAELLSAGPRVIPRLRSPFRRALRHASRRCSRDPWRSQATEWHLRPAEIDRLGWEVGRLTKLQPSRAAGCGGTSAARLKGLQGSGFRQRRGSLLPLRNLLLESLQQKSEPSQPDGLPPLLTLHIPSGSEQLERPERCLRPPDLEDGLERARRKGSQPSLESVHLKPRVSAVEKTGDGMPGNLRELEDRKAELLRTGACGLRGKVR